MRARTRTTRAALVQEFELWLGLFYGILSVRELVNLGEERLNDVLDEYGRHLY